MKHVEIILCTDILEVIEGFNGKKYWAGVSIILDILCIARTLAMVACYLVKLGGSRNFVGAHTPTSWDASLVELQTSLPFSFLCDIIPFEKKKRKKISKKRWKWIPGQNLENQILGNLWSQINILGMAFIHRLVNTHGVKTHLPWILKKSIQCKRVAPQQ